MAVSDHLNEYKHFFSEFAATVNPEDQLPVKVGGYCLCESELAGEIVDWILQYLDEKGCPSSLIPTLTKIVVDGIRQVIASQPAAYRREDNTYQPLKLMQAVTAKVNEVCLSFLDQPLSALPAPAAFCLPKSACAVKNTRRRMEDRHTVIHDFHRVFDVQGGGSATYYGVFDGHAGTDAAVYTASHLHQYLAESTHYPSEPVRAIQEAFLKTDDLFLDKSHRDSLHSGTTALCALLRHDDRMLHVAWVGDSQALLVTRGQPLQLVRSHKPDREDEKKRIEDSGGCVLFWGMWRVNGQLAVSRAIGDVDYKPWVCAEPDIVSLPLTDDQDFLILACDGLWDYVSEQEAVVSVYNTIRQKPGDLEAVSQGLVQLSKVQGSVDNISVIVVFLTDPAVLASLDVWPTCQPDPVNTMDDPVVQTNGSSEPAYQKSNLLLDLDVAGEKLKQAGAASPSATDLYFLNRPPNGKEDTGYDDDDFGPETDVDGVDDVLLSPAIAAAKAAALASEVDELQRRQTTDYDHVAEAREETPTPPADDVAGGASLVPETDNVAESGEESEDEWNYYRVESTDKPVELTDKPSEQQLEEEEDDDNMESRLNPNAAEFVPSPTAMLPSMEELLSSMSPCKPGVPMDDIRVPTSIEFQEEVSQRPAEGIQSIDNNPFGDVSFNPDVPDFGNVPDISQLDIKNPYKLQNDPEHGEVPDLQNPFSNTDHLFNKSEISSTHANFGDESTNIDFQDMTFSNFMETDTLNKSMVENEFFASKALEENESRDSSDFFEIEKSPVPDSDSLQNKFQPSELQFDEVSEGNPFYIKDSSVTMLTSEKKENFDLISPQATPPPKDDALLLPKSEITISNVCFDQLVDFSPAYANIEFKLEEDSESKVISPHFDIEQEAEVTREMEHQNIEETLNQASPSVFEHNTLVDTEQANILQPLTEFSILTPEPIPHSKNTDDSTCLEDFLNAVETKAEEKDAEMAKVEPVKEVLEEVAFPVREIAATGAVLAGLAVAASTALEKTSKADGASKAQEKKLTDKSKAAGATKPVPGNRSVTGKPAVKSSVTSPTKPQSPAPPQAAPRLSATPKKPLTATPSRLASKASPATTKVSAAITATNKVSASGASQARPAKTTAVAAASSATSAKATSVAAKTVPAKTPTTTARTRPTTTTAAKPSATEKKPALSNGDVKAPIKRPEQTVIKKLIPAAASKPLARPASAPVATKTTKTSTVSRTTSSSTASSKPAPASKLAAKTNVNGVSKPKVPTTTLTARPKTTGVTAKSALVDKQGKEIANKQLSQTVKSSTTTRTTTTSAVAARKVGGNVTKTTTVTTSSKSGGPIKRPIGTTTVTKTATKIGDAPLEEKVVIIQEFIPIVNKDDSPIVDNALTEVLISTD